MKSESTYTFTYSRRIILNDAFKRVLILLFRNLRSGIMLRRSSMLAVIVTIFIQSLLATCHGIKVPDYSRAYFAAERYALLPEKPEDTQPYPTGVVEHPTSGSIFVTDTRNHRVLVLNSKLQRLDDFSDEAFRESRPTDLAVTKDGNVAVLHSSGLIIFDQNYEVLHRFENKGDCQCELKQPEGIAVDKDGLFYIADYGNYRIVVLAADGSFLRQFGLKGHGPGEFRSHPCYIAVSADNRVVVTDDDGNLYIFFSDGTFHQMIGAKEKDGPITTARGMAFDHIGNIIVADLAETGQIKIIAFNENGYDVIKTIGDLNEPRGLSVTSDGHILLSEINGKHIRKIIVPHKREEL